MDMKILAIDPGNIESAYILVGENLKILEFGKVENYEMLKICDYLSGTRDVKVAIEMIASYGMPVGKEIFDTCVLIGRIYEIFYHSEIKPKLIYRKEVKLNLCNSVRAKDGNVIQALKDRFGDRGTKANPGFFYGVKADVWQAYAVGVTYHDLEAKI